ncbi:hypothetical protein FOZ63_027241 [Perkinsus olseni]|uniref:Uncharacterized protein n=1 Tax=Perkinsus olseni TaxID=32597 RepID=A0A7J6SR33_PEROL|nr:hypothetical protein FOZ62_007429 [Perkinsus olseni]KAF4735311.1 hypothetical protein FOZ63_027241 [Perkinsus olseni]
MAASGGAAIWSISMVALTLLVILGLGVFAWTTFVELQPPRAVRNSMLTVLLLITLLEVYLYAAGLASCRWLNFLFVAFLCNFWGLFDVLRTFPRIRDLDSWQSAKLTVLLMLKTFAYCLCLAYNSSRAVLFMITTFTNVWLLPIMFLVALPYGFEVTEGPRLDEPHTEDIAITLWRVITSPTYRSQALMLLQDSLDRESAAFMRLFPLPCQRWLSDHNEYVDRKLCLGRRCI